MTTPSGFDGGQHGRNYPGGAGGPSFGQQQNPHGYPEANYSEQRPGGYQPYYESPPGPPPPMPPGRGPKSGGLLWGAIAVLGVTLVAVIAVFVVMLVMGGRSQTASTATTSTAASAPALTPAPTTAAQPPPALVVPVAPAPAQPQTQVVEVVPPSSGTRCVPQYAGWGFSASGNSGTTCAFAEAVRSSYNDAGGGTGYFDAYSPVTGKVYTMYCSGYAPVTCTGGNNAVVYLY